MLVGYARVSTSDQNFALQLDALKTSGCEKVFQDAASGFMAQRQGLNDALEYLREGDILHLIWHSNSTRTKTTRLVTFAEG